MTLTVTPSRSLRPRSIQCDYNEDTPPRTPRSKRSLDYDWPDPPHHIESLGKGVEDVHKPVLIDDLVMGIVSMGLHPTEMIKPEEAYTKSEPFMNLLREVKEVVPTMETIRDDALLSEMMWSRFGLRPSGSAKRDIENIVCHIKGFARCWTELAHSPTHIRHTFINNTTQLGLYTNQHHGRGAVVRGAVGIFYIVGRDGIPEQELVNVRFEVQFEVGYGSSAQSRTDQVGTLLGPLRNANSSCEPNCRLDKETETVEVNYNRRKYLYTVRFARLRALRDVKAGEELTFNYGQPYFDANVIDCACPKCTYAQKRDPITHKIRRRESQANFKRTGGRMSVLIMPGEEMVKESPERIEEEETDVEEGSGFTSDITQISLPPLSVHPSLNIPDSHYTFPQEMNVRKRRGRKRDKEESLIRPDLAAVLEDQENEEEVGGLREEHHLSRSPAKSSQGGKQVFNEAMRAAPKDLELISHHYRNRQHLRPESGLSDLDRKSDTVESRRRDISDMTGDSDEEGKPVELQAVSTNSFTPRYSSDGSETAVEDGYQVVAEDDEQWETIELRAKDRESLLTLRPIFSVEGRDKAPVRETTGIEVAMDVAEAQMNATEAVRYAEDAGIDMDENIFTSDRERRDSGMQTAPGPVLIACTLNVQKNSNSTQPAILSQGSVLDRRTEEPGRSILSGWNRRSVDDALISCPSSLSFQFPPTSCTAFGQNGYA